MRYRWNILSKADNIKDVLRSILKQKNIPTEKIREFIDFNINPYDPYLLTNMKEAVERVKLAKKRNEKICVIGDYDADGVTGTTVLVKGLKKVFEEIFWQIPNRFKDGYGINNRLIDEAYNKGCSLIITVDNGTAAIDAIKYAESLGIDVIVTDHHQLKNELPTKIIINPQIDNSYPFKSIAGCMVAFKFILALFPNLEKNDNELYNELLSITTIGTIADVMPIIDENRYYVKKGLEILSNTNNIGLKALLTKFTLYGKELKTDNIAFKVGPSINASGRLESADIAVELLLCNDKEEAEQLAEKIINFNEERKDLQEDAFLNLEINEEDKFIIVYTNDIGHGISGIVAGNIAEKYQKPCFVLSGGKDGIIKGSGRSVFTYDINSCLQDNKDIILKGGGHEAACGVSLLLDNLEEFRNRCNIHFDKWLMNANVDDLNPTLDITCEIPLSIIDNKLINNIDKLRPYGNGNLEPLFATKNTKVDEVKVVGKNKNVIQMRFSIGNSSVKAVGFKGIKDKYEELGSPNKLDIVYTVGLNEWPQGVFTPQLIIRDIENDKMSICEEISYNAANKEIKNEWADI